MRDYACIPVADFDISPIAADKLLVNARSPASRMTRFAFEDFPVGETVSFGEKTVTEEEIIAFAKAFDPQPVHTDPEAAKASLLGGHCASGWHTIALFMRMMCDEFLLESTSIGSPGVEELNWKQPVRPGDTLSVARTCLSARVSGSRPDMGICVFRYDVMNQTGAIVMTMTVTQLFTRRQAA